MLFKLDKEKKENMKSLRLSEFCFRKKNEKKYSKNVFRK